MLWRTKSRCVTVAGAFSLMEVLIALGIFVIGMVAIASIFPVAAVMQRETARGVVAEQLAQSAEDVLDVRGILETDLTVDPLYVPGGAWDIDGQVHEVIGGILDPLGAATLLWPLTDRSYPASVIALDRRTYFWVPLIRDADTGLGSYTDWHVFVFILRRHGDATYLKPANDAYGPVTWANDIDPSYVPGVRRVAVTPSPSVANRFDFDTTGFNSGNDQVVFGAQVLDNFGRVYVVRKADADGFETDHDMILPDADSGLQPSAIWYAPVGSAGRSSPALLVEGPFSGVVR